jgi:ADP-ribose pyrophosphatase
MKSWKRIEPTIINKIGWRTIVTKTFEMPDGRTADFQTISTEHTHAIATIALTTDGRVVVAEQFRPGPEKVFDELPGGGLEKSDVDFEAAARRELREETGYDAGSMKFLGDVYKDAYQNTTWHYFLARDCTPNPAGQQLDDHEHVSIKHITIDQLFENACTGRMTDSEAVLLAYEELKQYKEKLE